MEIEKSILEIEDLVDYLKLPEKGIYELVEKNEIPFLKVGNQLKFKTEVIDEWLELKSWQHNNSSFKCLEKKANKNFNLSEYIFEEICFFNIKASTKKTLLLEMIGKLISNEYISNGQKFIFSVLERENLCSTGIGKHIAIPHPKDIDPKIILKESISIAICKKGVNFNSVDKKPVYLIILSCFKDKKIHLKMISKLSLLLRNKDFYDKIVSCENYSELIKVVNEFDKF
jgi:excisionase family DNA binding protein